VLPAKVNDSQHICFHAVIDDPNIAGTNNYPALFTLDSTTGTQTLIAKRDDILPGQTWGIWNLAWDSSQLAFNNAGQVLFMAQTYDNPNVQQVIYRNSTLIAQTGQTPSFGGTYTSLFSASHSNNGTYAFRCDLSNSVALVSNGGLFVKKTDFLPSIEPFAISELYESLVGDDERVMWIGLWNLPDGSQSKALFADYSILVEEGQTSIGGVTVTDATPAGGYHRCLSPSGQYFAFKATLQDGTQGAYLVNLWQ